MEYEKKIKEHKRGMKTVGRRTSGVGNGAGAALFYSSDGEETETIDCLLHNQSTAPGPSKVDNRVCPGSCFFSFSLQLVCHCFLNQVGSRHFTV